MLFEAGPLGGAANYSNGFLPAAFQPTRLRDQGTPVLDLLPPEEFASGQRASLDPFRDLHATLLAALGLEHEELGFEVNGRNERLTGVAGGAQIIPGVLA